MEAIGIQEMCRLCPSDKSSNNLINVLDNGIRQDMAEVILATTGIQISECDIISKKICNKCYDNVLKVNDIRQVALKQDQNLKKKCEQYLSSQGIRLPNSCITIRKDYHVSTQDDNKLVSIKTSLSSEDVHQPQIELPCDDITYFTPSDTIESNNFKRPDPDKELFSASFKHSRLRSGLHSSIIDVYRKYPTFKLPGKCFHRNLSPIVSLVMGEVETYFRKNKLDMNDFIYKPTLCTPLSSRAFVKQVAKKRTAVPFKASPFRSPTSIQKNEDTSKSVMRHTTDNIVFSDSIPYETDSKTYTANDAINTTSNCNSARAKSEPIKRSYTNKHPIVQRQQKMRFSKLKSLCNSLKSPIKKVPKVSKLKKPKDKSFADSPNSTKFSSFSNKASISHSMSGIRHPNITDNSFSTTVEPYQDQNTGSVDRTSNDKCRTEISHENDKPALVIKSKAKSSKLAKGKSLLKKNVSKHLAEKLGRISKNKHGRKSNSLSNSSMYEASSSNDGQSKLAKLCKKSDSTLAVKHNLLRTAADSALVTKTSQSVISTNESSVPSTSKPEFIQSLGLTPALSLSNSLNIFVCQLCGSQQKSAVALNKHVIRHRTCPFCKLKFKYGENKQFHVDHNCPVKRIITASESAVDVKKPAPNAALRKTINDVLKKNQKSTGSDGAMDDNNVIILTDDEDVEFISENESQNMLNTEESQEPAEESVSIVKPIISICNNTILDTLGNKLSDKNLVKKLVTTFRHASIPTEEKGCYTESVTHHEPIFIKNQSCRLKNLQYDLFSYMVPVKMKHGNFDVSFCSKSETRRSDPSAQWTALPIVNKPNLKPVQDIPIMNTTYPLTFLTSQVQSSQLSLSSIQLMTTSTPTMSIFLPNAQSFLPSSSVSIQPSLNNTVPHTQTISNTFFSPIQTTPLLQNYTLSMTPLPIINNQVPVQTSSSTPKESNSVADSTIISSSKSKTGKSCSAITPSTSTDYSQRKDSKVKKIHKKTVSASFQHKKLRERKSKRKKQTRTRKQSTKVKVANLVPQSSKSSKLRVKNLWELK